MLANIWECLWLRVEGDVVPLKYIEYGVYGDLLIIYPKPYSVLLMGDNRV